MRGIPHEPPRPERIVLIQDQNAFISLAQSLKDGEGVGFRIGPRLGYLHCSIFDGAGRDITVYPEDLIPELSRFFSLNAVEPPRAFCVKNLCVTVLPPPPDALDVVRLVRERYMEVVKHEHAHIQGATELEAWGVSARTLAHYRIQLCPISTGGDRLGFALYETDRVVELKVDQLLDVLSFLYSREEMRASAAKAAHLTKSPIVVSTTCSLSDDICSPGWMVFFPDGRRLFFEARFERGQVTCSYSLLSANKESLQEGDFIDIEMDRGDIRSHACIYDELLRVMSHDFAGNAYHKPGSLESGLYKLRGMKTFDAVAPLLSDDAIAPRRILFGRFGGSSPDYPYVTTLHSLAGGRSVVEYDPIPDRQDRATHTVLDLFPYRGSLPTRFVADRSIPRNELVRALGQWRGELTRDAFLKLFESR